MLPLASTGGFAVLFHRETLESWDKLAPGGLSLDDYRKLVEPMTDVAELRRLLRTMFSPKMEETSPRQQRYQAQPPRVRITCEVEKDGVRERKELPFVVGVLADLSGNVVPRASVRQRSFLFAGIDREHFDLMLRYLPPRLALEIPSHLGEGESLLRLTLRFRQFNDFRPEKIVEQVPALKALLLELRGAAKSLEAARFAQTDRLTHVVGDLESKLSLQLREILHHPSFQRLEATWRGLHYLAHQSETGADLKIRVLNVSKEQLLEDLSDPAGIEQNLLFREVCPRNLPRNRSASSSGIANSITFPTT